MGACIKKFAKNTLAGTSGPVSDTPDSGNECPLDEGHPSNPMNVKRLNPQILEDTSESEVKPELKDEPPIVMEYVSESESTEEQGSVIHHGKPKTERKPKAEQPKAEQSSPEQPQPQPQTEPEEVNNLVIPMRIQIPAPPTSPPPPRFSAMRRPQHQMSYNPKDPVVRIIEVIKDSRVDCLACMLEAHTCAKTHNHPQPKARPVSVTFKTGSTVANQPLTQGSEKSEPIEEDVPATQSDDDKVFTELEDIISAKIKEMRSEMESASASPEPLGSGQKPSGSNISFTNGSPRKTLNIKIPMVFVNAATETGMTSVPSPSAGSSGAGPSGLAGTVPGSGTPEITESPSISIQKDLIEYTKSTLLAPDVVRFSPRPAEPDPFAPGSKILSGAVVTDNWPDPENVDSVPFKDKRIKVKVTSVYDGDTCTVLVNLGTYFLKMKLRILGVDAPEIKVRGSDGSKLDELQERAGAHVRDVLTKIIDQQVVEVIFRKWDKFTGRILAELFLPSGESLKDWLLSKGYAKEYDGKKKSPWTQVQLRKILKNS